MNVLWQHNGLQYQVGQLRTAEKKLNDGGNSFVLFFNRALMIKITFSANLK